LNVYLDLIAEGTKTPLDAINELIELEINERDNNAIKACVKVANFPFFRTLNDYDFNFQPSVDKARIM
ncbi:ATP-binding protein, partial [Acinetobacter baumannii]|nr:ATP-binding protein [Acinetobacter baumannii]